MRQFLCCRPPSNVTSRRSETRHSRTREVWPVSQRRGQPGGRPYQLRIRHPVPHRICRVPRDSLSSLCDPHGHPCCSLPVPENLKAHPANRQQMQKYIDAAADESIQHTMVSYINNAEGQELTQQERRQLVSRMDANPRSQSQTAAGCCLGTAPCIFDCACRFNCHRERDRKLLPTSAQLILTLP